MIDIKKFLIDNSHKVPAVFQFAKFSSENTDIQKSTIVKRINYKVFKGLISISPFYKDITRHI